MVPTKNFQKMFRLLSILLLLHSCHSVQNIKLFGAIANEDSVTAQWINQKAINAAIIAANRSDSIGDNRIVVIPKDTYYSMPIALAYVNNIKI